MENNHRKIVEEVIIRLENRGQIKNNEWIALKAILAELDEVKKVCLYNHIDRDIALHQSREIDRLKALTNDLENHIEDFIIQVNQDEIELVSARKEIERVKEQLRLTNTNHCNAEAELSEAKKEIEELILNNKQSEEYALKLEVEIEELQAEVERLKCNTGWAECCKLYDKMLLKEKRIDELQAELSKAKEEIDELLKTFKHYHHAGKEHIDICDKCGLDLRHDIHIRGGIK